MQKNHKEKRPLATRTQLMEAAAQIVTERGVDNLTLDLVAQRAGISKGGLIHHFPTRQTLLEGLFQSLLAVFQKSIEDFISIDENPRGRFTRAYIKSTTFTSDSEHKNKLLAAFALATSKNEILSTAWQDWQQKQIDKYNENVCSVVGRIVRYAADGMWLEDCCGGESSNPEERENIVEYLIQLTYAFDEGTLRDTNIIQHKE
jgi:AcrR family transcriptional regulator